jgi:uncharacterized membrane protein YfcA
MILLLFTSLLAGALNAVAGGGTFFVFPALTLAGVPPVAANITCTIALWPAAVSSIFAYRGQWMGVLHRLPMLCVIGVLGGWAGAYVLLHTSNDAFSALVPWLMLGATLIFAYGKQCAAWVARMGAAYYLRGALAIVMFSATAFYGGFFGAGIGILTLAVLYMMGMEDMHQMNALKTMLASAINAAAFFTFVASPQVVWDYALPMAAAAIIGGYGGARLALRLPQHYIHRFVLCVAVLTTGYFFVR